MDKDRYEELSSVKMLACMEGGEWMEKSRHDPGSLWERKITRKAE
jgi:hypothetical protein